MDGRPTKYSIRKHDVTKSDLGYERVNWSVGENPAREG